MSKFDDLTTQDLVDRALQSRYTTGENAHQMVKALAMRLKATPVVGRPHISLACSCTSTFQRQMWRCVGPGQTTQFGQTPQAAYDAWARMIARRPYHPRRHFMPVEP